MRGRLYGLSRKTHTIPWYVIEGSATILISPLWLVSGASAFKKRVLNGSRKLAKAAGRAAAVIGYAPKPYKNVVGE